MFFILLYFFFHRTGSSTDISPSVIDYYDRLSGNCDPLINSIQTTAPTEKVPPKLPPPRSVKPPSDQDHQTSATLNFRSEIQSPVTDQSHVSPKKTFGFLSQNVQRMVNNSLDEVNEPSVLSVNHQSSASPTKTATTATFAKERIVKHKHGHSTQLPLSKNTSKLTLAGNEMVDAYESALEYSSSTESLNRKSTSNTCSGYFGSDTVTDSEKTPTNFDKNKSFIYTRSFSQSQSSSNGIVAQTVNPILKDKQQDDGSNSLTNIKDSDSSDDLYEDCINEAINFMVNVPETLQSKKTASLQKLSTISERKRLQCTETDPTTPKDVDPKLETTSVNNNNNKNSPKTAQKLALPEITRLKPHHRPLSASSISSTTSSSSSGSEHLTNKLGISYLASVESLADHSENESSSNPSLTLCERACMEIIDSERSYVDDLGQVIDG